MNNEETKESTMERPMKTSENDFNELDLHEFSKMIHGE